MLEWIKLPTYWRDVPVYMYMYVLYSRQIYKFLFRGSYNHSGFKYNLDRTTTCHNCKFDLTAVRTHELQIIPNTFHIPKTLALTTKPSGASNVITGESN